MDYNTLLVTEKQAEDVCFQVYGINGKAEKQAGELDANFKITTENGLNYILKISRPAARKDAYFDFQQALLVHIDNKKPDFKFPKIIKTLNGENDAVFIDKYNQTRQIRLLDWTSGRLLSSVNPQLDNLRYSLGTQCGAITQVLNDFNHDFAKREFPWDIAQVDWIYSHLNLFNDTQKNCLVYFLNQFKAFKNNYNSLRKSVIHNDANDNNVVVNNDLTDPTVLAVIDYGDAIYTQTINDLSVTLAYAIMEQHDPLAATLPLISGYHSQFSLTEEELSMLYTLIAMRLAISVTKSAINKIAEPDNVYLTISEKPAWELLHKWRTIPKELAHFSFRAACGFTPVPNEIEFRNWALNQQFNLKDLLPSLSFNSVYPLDLSIGSLFLGNYSDYKNTITFSHKINELQLNNPDTLIAGGYLEPRPLYATDAYKIEGNNGH
jgi:Ser/Thr protein kinase RdoA (MazF antagonist)